MIKTALAVAFACLFAISVADARPRHHHHRAAHADSQIAQGCVFDNNGRQTCQGSIGRIQGHPRAAKRRIDANGNAVARSGLITVPTAAGIDITVNPEFAPKIQGFIKDMVDAGYHPQRIHCYSLSRSHVAGSLHFSGRACDFNQHGWGKTDRPMYHVAALAQKWGVRDGCTFRDCGHIDAGTPLGRFASRHRIRLARR